mgnify:CR=1 FL=1
MADIVSVQFPRGGKPFFCLTGGATYPVDSFCVLESDHGPAVAKVVRRHGVLPNRKRLGHLRRVLRGASTQDLEYYDRNRRREREAYRLCRQLIDKKRMVMKLVDVAYTLEGRKAVFFFTAENRVDFRELVKELATALKTKIEMRQIGVRDEARRLGGVGACGRSLCCCTFLKDFVSVSIRMAKDQGVSLNPTKVSGICGRLMCCLSYEHEPGKPRRRKGGEGAPAEKGAHPCPGCPAGEERAEDGRTAPAASPATDRPPGKAPEADRPAEVKAPHPTPTAAHQGPGGGKPAQGREGRSGRSGRRRRRRKKSGAAADGGSAPS